MLGWEFFVSRQSDAKSATPRTGKASLPYWKAGLGGTDWINALVSKGLAVDLGGNGYPNRYAVSTGVLIAVLEKGLRKHSAPLVLGDDYVQPSGWTADVNIDVGSMRTLDPLEILIIEAWDQS